MGSDEERVGQSLARGHPRGAAPVLAAWPDPSSRRRDLAPGGWYLRPSETSIPPPPRRRARRRMVRWSPDFGQADKLGSPARRTDPDDGQTDAVLGGFQGEG